MNLCIQALRRTWLQTVAVGLYTAIIKRDGDWWIGWVEEVPGVNAQERSREELLASLRVVLAKALEFNREEARAAAESGFEEEILSVWSGASCYGTSTATAPCCLGRAVVISGG